MPSSLVPSFPGIRRACGTCVRVCRSGLAAGRTDGRRCCGIAQCVCTEGCCAAPGALPCLPRCLVRPGGRRGTGMSTYPRAPRLAGPTPCVGSGRSAGPCPTPALLLLDGWFFFTLSNVNFFFGVFFPSLHLPPTTCSYNPCPSPSSLPVPKSQQRSSGSQFG